ncbi:MAG: hypothetical protein IPO28_12920 [Holophagaceae bacterium]|nr:hypothetical protein [Holophagaceae bacterium]
MVRALLERGDQVVALSRGVGHGLPDDVQQFNLDPEDPASLAMLPRSWDGVIHLAGASIPSLFHARPGDCQHEAHHEPLGASSGDQGFAC